MKKILLILLMIISFTLFSCGQTTEDVTNDDANTPSTNDKTPVEPEIYVPTDTILFFSDENEDKIITESNVDISQYTTNAEDDILPYQYFSDGMCLQRDAINRIWGKASKTSFIAAEINGQVYYGTVKSREWEIYLPKMNAGGPYELTIISESGRYTIKEVYIGEVYFLGGQSNMEWTVGNCGSILDYLYDSSDCNNDNIRLYNVGFHPQTEPTNEVVNSTYWKGANKNTIPAFTAVGYLFGKQMQEELGCPVGLIAAPIGGSNMEFWLSAENYETVSNTYRPYITNDVFMQPSQGYNGMLYPLTGVNVRGVLWYQGESNAFGTQAYYDTALKLFVNQCREMFNNEMLSFTICELARYEMDPLAYSIVNEKINIVANDDPYIVVARNLDQGEWTNIHPKDKREIASRAAYETLRIFFKKDKMAPVSIDSYEFNADGTVTITLNTDAKLVNGTNGFEVYVDGRYSYDCTVKINGNKITISASSEITKVRYGYTCKMDEEIKNDVSKMVTVYDNNGFPLDLFLINK